MPTYSHDYDNENYDPAMPVTEIDLISSVSGEPAVALIALIDSGADATMLPIDALESAGALHYRTRSMRGVTGQSIPVDTYFSIIKVGPYTIHGIKAVAVPAGSEAILGRDVLNQLEIVLNGPAQELWVA
jgi:hypothetical protein